MTPEQINIAIAESLGWKNVTLAHTFACEFPEDLPMIPCGERPEDGRWGPCPRYTTDLNAMHEAESALSPNRRFIFQGHLSAVTGNMKTVGQWHLLHATAAQRAEAYLKTLNLWTES